MNINEIPQFKATVLSHINAGELHDAFSKLKSMANDVPDYYTLSKLETLEETYKYMISYAVDGSEDSERDKIYTQIKDDLSKLCLYITKDITAKNSTLLYYSTYRYLKSNNKNIENLIASIAEQQSIIDLYNSQDSIDQSVSIQNRRKYDDICSDLFKAIWVNELSSSNCTYLKDFFSNPKTDDSLLCLIACALMLNCNNEFNENSATLLFDLYEFHKNKDSAIKILVCLLITLYINSVKLINSHNITLRIQNLISEQSIKDDIRNVFLQLIRSRGTEKIKQKVQTELNPKFFKLDPELRKKLQSESFDDPEAFASNPDWQEMLDKSGIADKMMELNKMQMEGSDVFLASFAKLKDFPFFSNISNWFLPFDNKQADVASLLKGQSNALISLINKAGAFCDSDIYSFIMSLASVPEQQRNMMLGGFDDQNSQLMEMESAKLPNTKEVRKNIANRFIQNLYRFFNLFPRKSEFCYSRINPFRTSLNLFDIPYIKDFISDIDSLKLIGEFYFNQELFTDALNIFRQIELIDGPSATVYQKIGFCYEKIQDFDKAAEYYDKVSLIKNNDVWTLKHLASCYRQSGNIERAINIYSAILELDNENIAITKAIGICLMESKRYEEALKFFYKAEYIAPQGVKSIRPIAWCSFLARNYEQSINYYNKIINTSEKKDANDFINRGHAYLTEGNSSKALENYITAAKITGIDSAIASINNDRHYLVERNVDNQIVTFITEKIKYDYHN